MRITSIKALDALVTEDPVTLQVTNVHETCIGILTGVRTDGRFDVYVPTGDDKECERVFLLSDCIVVRVD